jgi:hypothetical protein
MEKTILFDDNPKTKFKGIARYFTLNKGDECSASIPRFSNKVNYKRLISNMQQVFRDESKMKKLSDYIWNNAAKSTV